MIKRFLARFFKSKKASLLLCRWPEMEEALEGEKNPESLPNIAFFKNGHWPKFGAYCRNEVTRAIAIYNGARPCSPFFICWDDAEEWLNQKGMTLGIPQDFPKERIKIESAKVTVNNPITGDSMAYDQIKIRVEGTCWLDQGNFTNFNDAERFVQLVHGKTLKNHLLFVQFKTKYAQ